MRFTDVLYTIPDILLIILLAMTLRPRIDELAAVPGFEWMQKVGPSLIAMFIVFALCTGWGWPGSPGPRCWC